MAIYRGPGGPGDATADASNASAIADAFADAASASAGQAAASAAAALAAQTAAELAETNAETAENNAEIAEAAAVIAKNAAEAVLVDTGFVAVSTDLQGADTIGTVAADIVNVNTVAGISSDISTVAGIESDVTAVAADATDIGTVSTNITNVNTVAGVSSNVTTVAGISANVTTVAGISSDVTTVATNNTNVTTVATNIASVNTCATDIAQIITTANDLNEAVSEIEVVANNIAAVDTVGTNIANVNTVAGISSDVTTVAGDSADIQLLADNIATISAKANAGANTDITSLSGLTTPLSEAQGGTGKTSLFPLSAGLFTKANPSIVAFTKTGNGTATTSSILYIEVNGAIKTIASGTSITMPTFAAGTDYAIWAKTDGTLQATSNHTSPPTANARKIGGFHYAAGGNATAQSGGNTTAQINEYSLWDLKFRPACSDPRGMALVAGGFWVDIYLANTDCDTNGTSKYNVTIADGSSPPKVPTKFGGNGSTTYGSLTWFESCELASAYGKRLLTQREFMAMAYGTTEASSIGSDQGSTILNAAYTSKWGVMQSTGVMHVWGDDRAGPFASAAWNANTEGRGSEYNAPNAVLLGGAWDAGANSGSRCSYWGFAASASFNVIGVRFSCDHLLLD